MVDNVKFNASDIEVQSFTNKMYIIGCIATIDKASEGAPCGGGGRKIILSKESIEKCAASFKGMPVNCVFEEWGYSPANFTGHGTPGYDLFFGYMEDVWADGDRLMAKIVVWKDTFPDLAFVIINAQRSLGFSIEIYPVQMHENEEQDFVLDEFEGVGCALLWRKCAAFGEETYIEKLAASLMKGKGDEDMTEKEMKDLAEMISATVNKTVNEKFNTLGIDKLQASVDELKNKPKNEEAMKKMEEIMASVQGIVTDSVERDKKFEEMKATLDKFTSIPAPKGSGIPNPDFNDGASEFDRKIAEIDASNMLPYEKLKAKARLQLEAAANKTDLSGRYKPLEFRM